MRFNKWMPVGLSCVLLVASCGGDDDDDDGGSAGSSGSSGTSGSSASSATGGAAGGGGSSASSGTSGSSAGSATGGAAGGGGSSGSGGTGGGGSGGILIAGAAGAIDNPGTGDVTVHPGRIDDVLVNPGMGIANFHFGWWCDLPPVQFTAEECAERDRANRPENHPDYGTAYFRWTWADLEPTQGDIDFELIDRTIESANALDETLGFRVMTILEGDVGIPDWLQAMSEGEFRDGDPGPTYWPDYRDATFQSEHARFAAALAERYDGHPGVDHIDIGSVGCWGEWNTACLSDAGGLIAVYDPADAAEEQAIADAYMDLIDAYTDAFTETPLVMLGIGNDAELERDVFVHAIQNGTGWRVDCWGDWGLWGDAWNHQEDIYPQMVSAATDAYSAFPEAWRQAPIQLEVCGTMSEWADYGWTATAPDGEVYRTFQWALEQHASVLNAKRGDIPDQYVDALSDMLVRNGYRFVVDSLNHQGELAPGDEVTLASTWSNLGVAPIYVRRILSYRLRGNDQTVTFESDQDVRDWMPGAWSVTDTFTLPSDLPAGTYEVEVAILDRAGQNPTTEPLPPLQLGIEGRGSDGWYALSQLSVE